MPLSGAVELVGVKPTAAETLLECIFAIFVRIIGLHYETCAKNSRKYPSDGWHFKFPNRWQSSAKYKGLPKFFPQLAGIYFFRKEATVRLIVMSDYECCR